MAKNWPLDEISKLRADLRQRLIDGKSVADSEIVACYPGYEGLGMASWLFGDAFAAHHMKIEAPWLDGPTQALFRLYPKCPVVLYFRCEYLYKFAAEEGLKKAQLLLEAEDDLVAQHDFLTNLYAQVLWNRGTRDPAVRKPFQAYAKTRLMNLFEQHDCNIWRDPKFHERQAAAIARNVPSVLIVTVPKSGSLFLQNTMEAGLDAPHIGLSPIGLFADLIPSRVRQFAQGGAVSVEHIFAEKEQLDILYAAGLTKFVFHFRDARQSALSMLHHTVDSLHIAAPQWMVEITRGKLSNTPGFFELVYLEQFRKWTAFLESWLEVIQTDTRFDIFVSTFETMTADEYGTVQRILDHFEVKKGVFNWSVLQKPKEERAGHFRKGLQDEWRTVLSPDGLRELDKAVNVFPRVAKLLRAGDERRIAV
jgi:hypothetical protein